MKKVMVTDDGNDEDYHYYDISENDDADDVDRERNEYQETHR